MSPFPPFLYIGAGSFEPSSTASLHELHQIGHGDRPLVVMANGLVEEDVLVASAKAVLLVAYVAEKLVDPVDINFGAVGVRR